MFCHSPCSKIVCRVRKNTVEPLADEASAETGETSLLAGLTTEQVLSYEQAGIYKLANTSVFKVTFSYSSSEIISSNARR